jgi:glutamate N-acetyltransferase/amino-acid N-acetyltransferase
MAVGKAGEPADRDRLSIGFGGTWAAKDGQPLADYDEAPVAAHLKGRDISIRSTWAWAKAAPRCGPAT